MTDDLSPASDVPDAAFRGVRLASSAALHGLLTEAADGPDRLVVDLTLGGWRGHEAARQLCAQLALPPDLPAGAPPGPGRAGAPVHYAEHIGAGIEDEAAGDRATRLADRLAGQVADALPHHGGPRAVLVLGPLPGVPWESEDIAFVRLLAARLAAGRVTLVRGADGGDAPPGRQAAGCRRAEADGGDPPPASAEELLLVPGLLDADITAACGADPSVLAAWPRLLGGRTLVPPALRTAPSRVSRLRFDALAVRAAAVPWLRAYAQVHGNNAFADPEALCRHAWAVFAAGGGDAAVRLAARAAECGSNVLGRAAARAQLDGMHIALCQYAQAAAAPDPSPALPGPLRGFLLQAKGWGLAMSPDPQQARRAEPYLAGARALLCEVADEREYLFLLNISALARLKSGDAEQALAWEQEIARRAARLRPADHRLDYVNAINQARLYRRSGDLDQARGHYRAAFATVAGVRSESDAVHAEVCLAKVAPDPAEGHCHWLRAALYWLAARTPDALAWRVVATVLGRRPGPGEDTVEAVSAALAGRLPQEVPAPTTTRPPRFTRLGPAPQPAPRWAATTDAWSVHGLAASADPGPDPDPDQHRPARLALRRLVHRLLCAACPSAELAAATLLAVDDDYGRGMPVGDRAMRYVCAVRDVPVLHTPAGAVALDGPERQRLRGHMRVRLGPAVERFERDADGGRVDYRRYRAPLRLTDAQAELAERARTGLTAKELTVHQETLLPGLLAARVLAVDPPGQVRPEAGRHAATVDRAGAHSRAWSAAR